MHRRDISNWFSRVRPGWSLARQLFVLHVIVVVLVVLTGAGLAWYEAQRRTEQAARDEVVAVARTLAAQPLVQRAVTGPDGSSVLQPLAERVRADTGVGFITIMTPSGVRLTHPNPELIGERFLGHIDRAVAGHVLTETYTGTLGPSVRAVVPVFGDRGGVVGLVAVGITVQAISAEVREQVGVLAAVAGAALVVGALLTHLISARLRRQTHGMTPTQLSQLYEYHDAILHAVQEGLLLVDPTGRIVLCNDGAAALLGVSPQEVEGEHVAAVGLSGPLAEALEADRKVTDEVFLTDDRVLLVNISPVRSESRDLGNVVTLRDHTELQALSGELDSVRGFAESLRSQAHESANRLHAVVSLIELGRPEEAVQFATRELELAQQLTDRVVGAVREPVLAAVLLGKSAEASERGVAVVVTEDTEVGDEVVEQFDSRDLVTVLGNLIDNAVEAVADRPGGRVAVTFLSDGEELVIEVADNGPGVAEEDIAEMFQRGWSTKADGRGLGLALVGQSVRRYGGTISVRNDRGAVFTVRLPVRSRRSRG